MLIDIFQVPEKRDGNESRPRNHRNLNTWFSPAELRAVGKFCKKYKITKTKLMRTLVLEVIKQDKERA